MKTKQYRSWRNRSSKSHLNIIHNNNLRKITYFRIESPLVNPNGCKFLYSSNNQKSYLYFRNRGGDCQNYYLIDLKGNYIRGYKIMYINNENKSVNAFLSISIPRVLGAPVPEIREEKVLLCKSLFRNYKDFIKEFREKTPELDWIKEWSKS